jgi:hypothetical protein
MGVLIGGFLGVIKYKKKRLANIVVILIPLKTPILSCLSQS